MIFSYGACDAPRTYIPRASIKDNVTTVPDATESCGKTLTEPATSVRFETSHHSIPDDWVHIRTDIIGLFIVAERSRFYTTAEGQISDV